MSTLLVGLALGLVANLAVEIFIRSNSAVRSSPIIRTLRWLGVSAGLLIGACICPSAGHLISICLFTISAASDFETKYLPPDGYTFGSVIAGILLSLWEHGIYGLRDAVVAQAMCFAVTTFAVAFFNLCDSGDIKLAMLFGVACGNLPTVVYSVIDTWIVAWLVVLITVGVHSVQSHALKIGIKRGLTLQPPLGPLLWVGLLIALVVQKIGPNI